MLQRDTAPFRAHQIAQRSKKRFAEWAKQPGEAAHGARRVLLGSQDRTAALRLMDTSGRERIRMVIDAANTARMECLDEAGKVVYALPQ